VKLGEAMKSQRNRKAEIVLEEILSKADKKLAHRIRSIREDYRFGLNRLEVLFSEHKSLYARLLVLWRNDILSKLDKVSGITPEMMRFARNSFIGYYRDKTRRIVIKRYIRK